VLVADRTFPVLHVALETQVRCEARGVPKSVRWSVVAPYEDQAKQNHGGQDLEKLASRGGLDVLELAAIIRPDQDKLGMTVDEAIGIVLDAVARDKNGGFDDYGFDENGLDEDGREEDIYDATARHRRDHPEAPFDFDKAMNEAWERVVDQMTADGEDVAAILKQAGENLTAWYENKYCLELDCSVCSGTGEAQVHPDDPRAGDCPYCGGTGSGEVTRISLELARYCTGEVSTLAKQGMIAKALVDYGAAREAAGVRKEGRRWGTEPVEYDKGRPSPASPEALELWAWIADKPHKALPYIDDALALARAKARV
jgi:hypothetical protein